MVKPQQERTERSPHEKGITMFNTMTRTRRLIAAGAAALALTTVGTSLDSSGSTSAASYTTANTGQTSSGAWLQSHGICGFGQFNFTVKAVGFERLQFGITSTAGTVWSSSYPIGQNYYVRHQVWGPKGHRYYVRGWDWTTAGWKSVTVLTSFFYPDSGMVLNGC
jgi:hypothetical protein